MDTTIFLVWAFAAISPVLAIEPIEDSITMPLETIQVPWVAQQKIDDLYAQMAVTDTGVERRPLSNFRNQYYFGEIGIGTPAQKLKMLFDTGSNILWGISSTFCSQNPKQCEGHQSYNHDKSSTYKPDGRKFSIVYGTGSANGSLSQDDFSIGSLKGKGQIFGEATMIDELFVVSLFDGICGFTFSPVKSRTGQFVDPPLLTLIRQKRLRNSVFAFYLTTYESKKRSELSLGAVDRTKHEGEFIYAPVISNSSWIVAVDQFSFDDRKFKGPFRALVDSGTTGLGLPKPLFDAIVNVSGAKYDEEKGLYTVDCGKADSLPRIIINISKKHLTLRGEGYVVKFIDPVKKTVFCWIGAAAVKQGVILGDSFLRIFYTKYDIKELRIGFAPAV